MRFEVKDPDFNLSPYTGLTRDSWIDAAKYVMDGVMRHIKSIDDPVVLPRLETEITYPHKNADKKWLPVEEKAEMFEGLCRTFFIAAPLLTVDPNVEMNHIRLADYYKTQVLRACTPGDPVCAGTYEELQDLTDHVDPFRPFQQTVETCALVICLVISKGVIWDTYTKEEKDTIAAFIDSFAKAGTVPQNWRLFNMLDLAFLDMNGYSIDRNIMRDHAQAILADYAGDGWYRDGCGFDYYSCWAFNVYAPLWNKWYGYEKEPDLAKRFEEYSNKLMETYPYFFDEDGYTNMWGRSGIYRNAATSAFEANFFLEHPAIDPGLARRITSGALMQFLGRDDTFTDGVPAMGFYRQFSPLVQGYSCAESPFWFGKAFMCLALPADHPFWTAKENEGNWRKLSENEVSEYTLDGPGLCFTNHKANRETILRTGKVLKGAGDMHGMWNYGKLSYNTKFPWESTPHFNDETGKVKTGDIESEQYVMWETWQKDPARLHANAVFAAGERASVLYRRAYFNYNIEQESCWIYALDLADIPMANGILRVDKHRLFRRPVRFTLGSYGFPDNGTEIIRKEKDGARAVILKGHDHEGHEKQLAMTIFYGFRDIDVVRSTGTDPDSENSLVIYALADFTRQYDASEPYIMVSQVITKESLTDFSDDELFPVERLTMSDTAGTGTYGDITVKLKNGRTYTVNHEQIEGHLGA